jgi:predicted RNA-binding protein with PIN domain
MRILIDGYNLIRAVPELAWLDRDDLAEGRAGLLSHLASYRAARGHDMTVVFDGTGTGGPSQKARGIPVLFSPAGRTADDLLAARCLAGKADVLVTSDAQLSRRVGRTVQVVRSDEFWERLSETAMAALKGEEPEGEGERGCPAAVARPGKKLPKKERKARRLLARL